MQNSGLIEKIQNLPLEIINEVEDFVDFLTEKQKKETPIILKTLKLKA